MWNNCPETLCDPIDPDTLPYLKATEIQREIGFKSPGNQSYVVKEIAQAIDFRSHFSISVSHPVREEDFDKFKDLVNKIWSARRRKELFVLFSTKNASQLSFIR